MSWKRALSLVLGVVLFSSAAIGAEAYKDPYLMVESVATQTFDRVNRDKDLIDADVEHLRVIVEQELMPYVDHKYAAYKVMGTALRKTTPEQRQRFVAEFRSYMVATFAQTFTQYNDQKTIFKPAQPIGKKQKVVTVAATVIDGDRPPVAVNFKTRRSKKNGTWRVFDLEAAGVSLLSTKIKEIGGLIRAQGIEAVIKQLAEKNAKTLLAGDTA